MKYSFSILLSAAIFFSACSSKKLAVKNPPSKTPDKVITNNNLVNRLSGDDYINRYKAIAISEMNKSGIPASITLAQGLLESGNGNGSLAREANNHFGIKCTSEWTGITSLKDDDKIDASFRVYHTPALQCIDHTQFYNHMRYTALF